MGDLNEGPPNATDPPPNLEPLFDTASHLVACYDLPGFDIGGRPGTFNACGLRDRLDYIFISQSLRAAYVNGQVFRSGLWGSRKTRPDKWDTYPDMSASVEQASDHAAVAITLDV